MMNRKLANKHKQCKASPYNNNKINNMPKKAYTHRLELHARERVSVCGRKRAATIKRLVRKKSIYQRPAKLSQCEGSEEAKSFSCKNKSDKNIGEWRKGLDTRHNSFLLNILFGLHWRILYASKKTMQ